MRPWWRGQSDAQHLVCDLISSCVLLLLVVVVFVCLGTETRSLSSNPYYAINGGDDSDEEPDTVDAFQVSHITLQILLSHRIFRRRYWRRFKNRLIREMRKTKTLE